MQTSKVLSLVSSTRRRRTRMGSDSFLPEEICMKILQMCDDMSATDARNLCLATRNWRTFILTDKVVRDNFSKSNPWLVLACNKNQQVIAFDPLSRKWWKFCMPSTHKALNSKPVVSFGDGDAGTGFTFFGAGENLHITHNAILEKDEAVYAWYSRFSGIDPASELLFYCRDQAKLYCISSWYINSVQVMDIYTGAWQSFTYENLGIRVATKGMFYKGRIYLLQAKTGLGIYFDTINMKWGPKFGTLDAIKLRLSSVQVQLIDCGRHGLLLAGWVTSRSGFRNEASSTEEKLLNMKFKVWKVVERNGVLFGDEEYPYIECVEISSMPSDVFAYLMIINVKWHRFDSEVCPDPFFCKGFGHLIYVMSRLGSEMCICEISQDGSCSWEIVPCASSRGRMSEVFENISASGCFTMDSKAIGAFCGQPLYSE